MEMQEYIQRLKQIREEKKMSMAEVAVRLGFSEQYLIMVELNEVIPSEKHLEKIAEFVINEIN